MTTVPQVISSSKTIADVLLREDLINKDQYEQAIAEYEKSERSLGRILTDMGAITEGVKIGVLQKRYKCELVGTEGIQPTAQAMSLIPKKYCIKYHSVPLRVEDGKLLVAVDDPSDVRTVNSLEAIAAMPVRPLLAKSTDITAVIEKLPSEFTLEEESSDDPSAIRYVLSLLYYPIFLIGPMIGFFVSIIFIDQAQKAWKSLQLQAFEQGLVFLLVFSVWAILTYWVHDIFFPVEEE